MALVLPAQERSKDSFFRKKVGEYLKFDLKWCCPIFGKKSLPRYAVVALNKYQDGLADISNMAAI